MKAQLNDILEALSESIAEHEWKIQSGLTPCAKS